MWKLITNGWCRIVLKNKNDEIAQYEMGRYINSNEAVWRILGFNMHERYPAVVQLVHLENAREKAANPSNTTLTAFFELCRNDEFAKTLMYDEVPKYYTWNISKRAFTRRKNGAVVPEYGDVFETNTIGRMYTIHPSQSECFYLKMLLHTVKGPTSFESLKIVNGEVYETYREACLAHGLLEDDQQ